MFANGASNLTNWASIATIGGLAIAAITFFVTLVAAILPFFHYLRDRKETRAREQFHLYHKIIAAISRGQDELGQLKLASQLAYIHELRNFPEYRDLTKDLLAKLEEEWRTNSPGVVQNEPLSSAIKGTLKKLDQAGKIKPR